MSDNWEQGPREDAYSGRPQGEGPTDEIDKRLEDLKRTVAQGANEAQQRLKRVVDKASEYWQHTKTAPEPHEARSAEEQRIRQLVNTWSVGNWRVARDLGTYMDIRSWHDDEVWEMTVQARWETRSLETGTEPYKGQAPGKPQPILPVWDYELPAVTSLKAPTTHTRVGGTGDILACTACNSTGHLLCATCAGRGWIVCPDCQGRTRIRCSTCRGRGYVADWSQSGKKAFFQKQAENLASSVTDKVADVFEGIRQQGVPIPNPVDNDPANKGRTVPCPDCVNGEIECTCGTGKRVCPTCQGAKTDFCSHCGGTGKIVRTREIVRSFDLRTQVQFAGSTAIPEGQLLKANGEVIYENEVDETIYADAAPEGVPMDVWQQAVQMVKNAASSGRDTSSSRPTLQVLELIRIPFTEVRYGYGNSDYTLYIYDGPGSEKFYAERYPARWDRIERLVRSITSDLMAPTDESAQSSNTNSQARGYRVPVEKPPYTITEVDSEDTTENRWNPNAQS